MKPLLAILCVVALTSMGCASITGSSAATPIPPPVTLALAGTATPDDAIIGAADAATARADWPLTIKYLEQLLNRDPTSVQYKARLYDAHVALGRVDLAQNKPDSARSEFAIARSIDPQRNADAAALQPTSAAPLATTLPAIPTSIASRTPPAKATTDPVKAGRDYLDLRTGQMASVGVPLAATNLAIVKINANPNHVLDSDWRKEVAANAANLLAVGESLQEPVDVPAALLAVDGHFASLGGDLVGLSKELTAVVTTEDLQALIKRSGPRIDNITGKLFDLKAEVAAARQQYGGTP